MFVHADAISTRSLQVRVLLAARDPSLGRARTSNSWEEDVDVDILIEPRTNDRSIGLVGGDNNDFFVAPGSGRQNSSLMSTWRRTP